MEDENAVGPEMCSSPVTDSSAKEIPHLSASSEDPQPSTSGYKSAVQQPSGKEGKAAQKRKMDTSTFEDKLLDMEGKKNELELKILRLKLKNERKKGKLLAVQIENEMMRKSLLCKNQLM